MQIVCPVCNAQYKVASDKMPEKTVQTACKKCGGSIVVEPRVGQDVILDAQIGSDFAPATSDDSGNRSLPSQARDLSPSVMTLISEYPELQDLTSDKLDVGEMFTSNKNGTYKTRQNKFKLKILKAVHGTLDRMLNNDEK
ncbi:MAG: zinc-ribbon domain-containing protein, partial [Syntrophobacterales bacterium]